MQRCISKSDRPSSVEINLVHCRPSSFPFLSHVFIHLESFHCMSIGLKSRRHMSSECQFSSLWRRAESRLVRSGEDWCGLLD